MGISSVVPTLILLLTGAAVLGHQITDIPPITYVNKFRTWVSDLQPAFRPGGSSFIAALPQARKLVVQPKLARHSAAVVQSTGRVVCFGGLMERPDLPNRPFDRGTNNTYIYDPNSNTWYTEPLYAARIFPPARVDHVSWSIGDYVFVHGGENETVMGDTWRYYNRSWRMMNFQAPRRTGHSAAVVDPLDDATVAYLFGGRDETGAFRNDLYSVAMNGSVTLLNPKGRRPTARAYHAVAVMQHPTLGPLMLIHGGYDGFTGLKDLYGYALRKNEWILLNSGFSQASTSFSGDLVPSLSLPNVYRHSCQAQFPTMFCVGGASSGDPISFEFDIALNRWVQQFFVNPNFIQPLAGAQTVLYVNKTNHTELLVIGGYTGVPQQFGTPVVVYKTSFQMEACPSPYINTDWLGICHVCPRGSGYNITLNPHRCFACPRGSFSDYSTCAVCAKGFYNPHNASSNVSACIPCPLGYFTKDYGSWTRTQCITCLPGTYASNGECVSCPAGTFGTIQGAMSLDQGCQPCPYGSYSRVGSTACTTCPPGTSGPPFIRSLDPYKIYLNGMAQATTGTPTCLSGGSTIATVYNDNFVWIDVQIRDFGELGLTNLNAVNPVDLNFFLPSLRLYAYFQGPGIMYYNCAVGQVMIPGCSYVTENQTTPLAAPSGFCSGNGFVVYRFSLRFMSPSNQTTLFIKGDGLRGLNLTFRVVNNFQTVSFSQWPSGYVIGQPRPLKVFAWLNNAVEPSSSFNAAIIVSCLFLGTGTGTSLTPTYTVNGNTAANKQTVAIVNGTALLSINFAEFASGCVFKSVDQFGIITQPNSWAPFAIQKPFALWATVLTRNTSNWGVINVLVRMVDAQGNTVTGDNSSEILCQLWTNTNSVMQPPKMIQRLVNGQTVFQPVVHNSDPRKWYGYGRFHIIHLSGLLTLLPDNITDRFQTHFVNGTMLRLVNYTNPIPAWVSVNTTLTLQIENVDRLTGEQDASRDVWVEVRMIGCGSRITLVNHTATVVRSRLPGGHGFVSLYIQGYDSMNCRLSVKEYITHVKISKGFVTAPFNVISPRIVVRDGCKLSQCSTCAAPIAGQIITYNITLQTLGGITAPVNDLVIRMVPLGNRSAIVPADNITERKVVGGNVTFPILYLPSLNATGVRFEAGRWVAKEMVNITYIAMDSPTFKRRVVSLGVHTYFALNAAIVPTATCLQVPRVVATSIVLVSRVPTWAPQAQPWTILFNAVNPYGIIDSTFSSSFSVQIQNCEQGLSKDLTFAAVDPNFGTTIATIYSAASPSNAAPFVVAGSFNHGQGRVDIKPLFTTDTDWNGGVRFCDVRISAVGLSTLWIAAPEFRKIYPACTVCPPGYWSSGGDGRNVSVTYKHPGGCMPCPVGTFSAYSGASDISVCSACQTGYGYNLQANTDNTPLEGAISCSYACPYSTVGQTGGGFCRSINALPRTDVTTNRYAQYGRIWAVCTACQCLAAQQCSAGQFYVSCPAMTTPATCEDPDNLGVCTWNSVSNVCQGPVFNCLSCPAGTVGKSACTLCTKAAACTPCDAGGWSSALGHTAFVNQYNLVQYRCTGQAYTAYQTRCTGANTGQCWNGTYSTTIGAKDNSTCLPCPSGHYCMQVPIYTSQNVCPPSCALSAMNQCGSGCTRCPYTAIGVVGMWSPIPCPPGTFNNFTGQWSPKACLPCPAGTQCPRGSAFPTWVDTANTQLSTGQARPTAIAFSSNPGDATSCTNEASDDAQGYVQDGRFSNFRTYWTRNQGANYVIPNAYTEYWGGKNWLYSNIDRSGNINSGSIQANASGAVANQKIVLKHVMPMEMVARVWVQYNLYTANMTKLRKAGQAVPKTFCGLAVGVHYTDGNELDSENYTGYARPFWYSPQTVVNSSKIIVGWYLLEILIQPTRPIRWIDFQLIVQGFYYGTARFDDASLKPSHRRLCNCSTGYFYNQSVKTSRVCERCPPGFACSGGTITRCVNSWSAVSYAGCQYCYPGWECDADGRGRQIPCAVYTQKDNGTETCSSCPLGHACKDGVATACSNGFYGDGGLSCIPCQPGYYSLPGTPKWQCQRCPPGTTSVAARWYCTPCPENHYSPNGTACYRCPNGQFAPQGGSVACRSCTNAFLEHYNLSVARNSLDLAIRVVPPYCEPFFKFQVDRVVDLQHGSLAHVAPSNTTPSVLYTAGPVLGTHVFRAIVTSGYLQPEQYADVQVRITNTAPVAQNDLLRFPHPKAQATHLFTTLMSNDYDPDFDDIFFATATLIGAQNFAANLSISSNRKFISVDLPATFTGPATIQYTLMDQFHVSTAACLAPSCLFSSAVTATFYCVDTPPFAIADSYSLAVGNVYSLDVLVNDGDVDGDAITILNATTGSLSGITPAVQAACPASCATPTTCVGVALPCTCSFDTQRQRCYPSNGREYFLDYTANTGVCGADHFTYTISAQDGISTATVTAMNTRCYCLTKSVGFNVIFLLDGTTSATDFSFQLSFADAVARRSAAGANFQYGIIEVGANRILQNLSNTYFNLGTLSRSRDGDRNLYTLGAGILMASTMMTTFGGGNPTYFVIVARKASYDNANLIGPLGIPARTVIIAVNPQLQPLDLFLSTFKNPYYNDVASSFVDLTQHTARLAENIMDVMCSH